MLPDVRKRGEAEHEAVGDGVGGEGRGRGGGQGRAEGVVAKGGDGEQRAVDHLELLAREARFGLAQPLEPRRDVGQLAGSLSSALWWLAQPLLEGEEVRLCT